MTGVIEDISLSPNSTTSLCYRNSFPVHVSVYGHYPVHIISILSLQLCSDIRLLASMKEVEEPFEKDQIGEYYQMIFTSFKSCYLFIIEIMCMKRIINSVCLVQICVCVCVCVCMFCCSKHTRKHGLTWSIYIHPRIISYAL